MSGVGVSPGAWSYSLLQSDPPQQVSVARVGMEFVDSRVKINIDDSRPAGKCVLQSDECRILITKHGAITSRAPEYSASVVDGWAAGPCQLTTRPVSAITGRTVRFGRQEKVPGGAGVGLLSVFYLLPPDIPAASPSCVSIEIKNAFRSE